MHMHVGSQIHTHEPTLIQVSKEVLAWLRSLASNSQSRNEGGSNGKGEGTQQQQRQQEEEEEEEEDLFKACRDGKLLLQALATACPPELGLAVPNLTLGAPAPAASVNMNLVCSATDNMAPMAATAATTPKPVTETPTMIATPTTTGTSSTIKPASMAGMATRRLRDFLKACVLVGVDESNLFKPLDLVHRSNERRVLRCLLFLSLALTKFGNANLLTQKR